eukprot:6193517-Pleurochrysis_carterae.AAC.1
MTEELQEPPSRKDGNAPSLSRTPPCSAAFCVTGQLTATPALKSFSTTSTPRKTLKVTILVLGGKTSAKLRHFLRGWHKVRQPQRTDHTYIAHLVIFANCPVDWSFRLLKRAASVCQVETVAGCFVAKRKTILRNLFGHLLDTIGTKPNGGAAVLLMNNSTPVE